MSVLRGDLIEDVDLATITGWELHSSGARTEKARSQFLPVIYKDTNHQHRTASPFNTSGPEEIYSLWMLLPATGWDSSVKDQHLSTPRAFEPCTALNVQSI